MLLFLGFFLLTQVAVARRYECGPHDLVPTIAKKTLLSPYYPSNYPRNIDCSYLLVSVAGFTTVVEVEYFYTEANDDYLRFSILQGTIELDRWSGMKVPGSGIHVVTNVTVNFHSDSRVQNRGYNLTYYLQPTPEPECGEMTRTASFVEQFILSPQYPRFYPHSIDCKYAIMPRYGYETVLKINYFLTERGHDTLHINSDGQRELTLSGSKSSSVIYQSQEVITLHFVTDESIAGTGYNISYYLETIPTSTPYTTHVGHGRTLTATLSKQYFTSINFPSRYPDNYYSRWVIRSPTYSYQILLKVVYFQIEEDYDTVTLTTDSRTVSWDGSVSNGTPFLGDAGRAVEIEFTSDSTVGSRGFNLSYVLVERGSVRISSTTTPTTTASTTTVAVSSFCDAKLSASPTKRLLESPFYPANYPNFVRCNYTIYSPQSDKIYLQIRDFETEYSLDSLTISSVGEETKVWSGSKRSGSYSSANTISLLFITDSSVTSKGFAIYYCTSDCFASSSLALQLGVGLSVPIALVILSCVIIGCCCCRKKRLREPSSQSGTQYPPVEEHVDFNLSLNYVTVTQPSAPPTILSPPSYQEFISDPDRFKEVDSPPPSYNATVGCYPV